MGKFLRLTLEKYTNDYYERDTTFRRMPIIPNRINLKEFSLVFLLPKFITTCFEKSHLIKYGSNTQGRVTILCCPF